MNKELLDKLYFLFESICCLAVEGPEFSGKLELCDAIAREASKGCEIIRTHNKPVEPKPTKCGWCFVYDGLNFCANCGRPVD
jgi:hypothetical protein